MEKAAKSVAEVEKIATGLSSRNPISKLGALSRLTLRRGPLGETLNRLSENKGIFDGDYLVEWLEERLKRHCRFPADRPLFQDLQIPLKIIATDINRSTAIVFSQKDTGNMPIADAVRASASIPFFFAPQQRGSSTLVDGGLMSNFPAWVLDDERAQLGIHTPVIGFRLGRRGGGPRTFDGLAGFSRAVLDAGMGGYGDLETRNIPNLKEIVVDPGDVETTSFDLSPEAIKKLVGSGREAAKSALARPDKSQLAKDIEDILAFACRTILEFVGKGKHLRANVFIHAGGTTARLAFSHNMENDPDRELELTIGAGAVGRCWHKKRNMLVDLENVRTMALNNPEYLREEWNMTAVEQGLVRNSLKSLLCVPIFRPEDYGPGSQGKKRIQAVLCFDSDNSKEEMFGKEFVPVFADEQARVLAPIIEQAIQG